MSKLYRYEAGFEIWHKGQIVERLDVSESDIISADNMPETGFNKWVDNQALNIQASFVFERNYGPAVVIQSYGRILEQGMKNIIVLSC